MDSNERITRLEMNVAELEKTVSELNDVMARQWREIDRLAAANRHLADRLKAVQEPQSDLPEPPPPHY